MATMDAIVFDPKAKKLVFTKVDMPSTPEKNEVIVKVAYSGICGTDLHIIDVSSKCSSARSRGSCRPKVKAFHCTMRHEA